MTDGGQGVCLHFIGVVRRGRGLGAETEAGNRARNASGLLVALRLSGVVLKVRRAKVFHVCETNLAQRSDRNSISQISVIIDFHLGRRRKGSRACRVVDELAYLRE